MQVYANGDGGPRQCRRRMINMNSDISADIWPCVGDDRNMWSTGRLNLLFDYPFPLIF